MMHLFTIPIPTGASIGAWRHPSAFPKTVMELEPLLELAKTAERGLFDAIFFADGNGVRNMLKPDLFSALTPSDRPAAFEPVTLLSAIAMHTKNIGLVATAATTYEAPYALARKFSSLDHLSGGRAGWNIVTGSTPEDSLNFGMDEHMARGDRYEMAIEFVDVAKGLWNSWADDAFPEDKAAGRYLSPDRVHTLDHKGEYLSVKGPLNALRPKQGYPVLFTAGQSEPGKELAARQAEGLFAMCNGIESAKVLYEDIKSRMAKYGRDRSELKVIPGIGFFVGETDEEAQQLYNEIAALIPPKIGVEYLEKMLVIDLKGYDLDDRLPAVDPAEVLGINSMRKSIAEQAEAHGWTIRQAYEHVVLSLGQPVVIGGPKKVADMMEQWFAEKACDGFMVQCPVAPLSLRRFVDLVVPELQRRGLFRKEYEATTLRGNIGLQIPENPFFARRTA